MQPFLIRQRTNELHFGSGVNEPMTESAVHATPSAQRAAVADRQARARGSPGNLFNQFLSLVFVLLVSDVYFKLVFDTGLSSGSTGLITTSTAEAIYSRIVVGCLFGVAFLIWWRNGSRSRGVLRLARYWLPLFALLWLNLPILSGDFPVLLRTLNFMVAIATTVFLAASQGMVGVVVRQYYWTAFLASLTGLFLYAANSPFSYFTDGYGYMFTGVFPHKDKASVTALFGTLLALYYLKKGVTTLGLFVLAVQLVTLWLSATLSSAFALLIGILAFAWPRLTLLGTSILAITLPITHSWFSWIAVSLGKDPTFTGRTLLWDYTIERAIQKPLFGAGFDHISSTYGWSQMLLRDFQSDRFFIPHSHNLWVEVFYKFGIVGLLVVAWTLILYPLVIATSKRGDQITVLAFAFLSALTAKSALTVPFLNTDVTAYYWAFFINVIVIAALGRSGEPA